MLVTHSDWPEYIEGVRSERVLAEAERILNTPFFTRSKRLRELFTYLLRETMSGRGAEISQYTIAFDCFKIQKKFDASNDSLIRSHVRRLRIALADYFERQSDETIVISLKEKAYCLSIWDSAGWVKPRVFKEKGPSIAVCLFSEHGLKEDWKGLSTVLADELVFALGSNGFFKILGPLVCDKTGVAEDPLESARRLEASLLLEGSISAQGADVVIIFRLTGVLTQEQVWTHRLVVPVEQPDIFTVGHTVCVAASQILGAEHGVVSSYFTKLAAVKPEHMRTVFDALILAWHSIRWFNFTNCKSSIMALRKALELEPNEGLLHATLAILLAVAPSQPLWSDFPSVAHVRKHVTQARRLDPLSPWTKTAEAYYFLLTRDRKRLKELAEKVDRSSPFNQTLFGSIGLCLSLQGIALDLAKRFIDECMAYNPDYPRVFHLGIALNYVHERDFSSLLKEIFKLPASETIPEFTGEALLSKDTLSAYPAGAWAAPLLLSYVHAERGESGPARYYWKLFTHCHANELETGFKRVLLYWAPETVASIMSTIGPLLDPAEARRVKTLLLSGE